MQNKIRIISISDIHGCTALVSSCREILKNSDAVLISGDITDFGGREDVHKVITEIRNFNPNVYAVSGNCDCADVEFYLEEEKINLSKKITDIKGVKILGFNGSLITPGNTPGEYKHNYYKEMINFYNENYPVGAPVIIVSHQPPYGTLCDTVGESRHIGCKSLTDFIEDKQPLACFCGHVHDADGIDQIGKTYIMNPGRFSKGGAILAEIDLKQHEAELTFIELFE